MKVRLIIYLSAILIIKLTIHTKLTKKLVRQLDAYGPFSIKILIKY